MLSAKQCCNTLPSVAAGCRSGFEPGTRVHAQALHTSIVSSPHHRHASNPRKCCQREAIASLDELRRAPHLVSPTAVPIHEQYLNQHPIPVTPC